MVKNFTRGVELLSVGCRPEHEYYPPRMCVMGEWICVHVRAGGDPEPVIVPLSRRSGSSSHTLDLDDMIRCALILQLRKFEAS